MKLCSVFSLRNEQCKRKSIQGKQMTGKMCSVRSYPCISLFLVCFTFSGLHVHCNLSGCIHYSYSAVIDAFLFMFLLPLMDNKPFDKMDESCKIFIFLHLQGVSVILLV